MSYTRLNLDLAIKNPLPSAVQSRLIEIRDALRWLKGFSENINEGQPNEENTTKATWHICHHDSGNQILCEPEVEI